MIRPTELRRGATLIELLVACGVYAFLVLSLFAIMRNGTRSWEAVEARGRAQSQIRIFERDAMFELKRASLSSIRIAGYGGSAKDTYQHGIAFESAMNGQPTGGVTPTAATAPMQDPIQFYQAPLGNSAMPQVQYQRWVLYYITRPSLAQHQADYGYECTPTSNSGVPNPDDVCPHKWLIRKDIYLYNPIASTNLTIKTTDDLYNNFIEDGVTEPNLTDLYAEAGGGSLVGRVRLLCREVLSLNIGVYDSNALIGSAPVGIVHSGAANAGAPATNGNLIELDVKTFRLLDAASTMTIGVQSLAAAPYTIQVNAEMMPDNQ